ncbi:hypothetical protein Snoj_26450 [Streptomyces nojiriensis]|uniref:PPM-type phosphatase domain-containing protein n=1 Tax=Streptomyces nojiriensis TaxID=66374 RepID=A0ABQ3SKR1_9ACTN|nr:SpoIIE family protein phosphatase [Streptomyces nojiriensis]GGS29872.1 hypothetical protein GCM10010205_70050 [Streptomyces nojiriensis]GHI68727.1 hypothetical protein Snoj_26450 [Streptomyces nojiriensis]
MTCDEPGPLPARRHSRATAGRAAPSGRPPAQLPWTPWGGPVGVGGTTVTTPDVTLLPGSRPVLYTDGLAEVRGRDIDDRLTELSRLLTEPQRPLPPRATR